ncbi:hypothetical protein HZC31_06805 [Candidatus Woesearchaeota archaeon]|nr:hypothetical protein [Candidatus Woesearchaeota archaeon]
MAKKSIGDINGWVFIGVGFIVMAVSIFFYDTLKIFIALGGLMTLYGLGKLSYDNLKAKIFPKDEEEGPIDLNKAQNPYIQQKAAQRPQQAAQQIQHHQTAHPAQQQRVQHQGQAHPQHRQSQQIQYTHPQRAQVQHRAVHPQHNQGRYCHSCGAPKQPHHRFCANCGARIM